MLRSLFQSKNRRQEELVEKYLIGFEEKYEARAEKMKKFISAVEEFLKQLEGYYIEHGEPVHLRYENN